MLRQTGTSPAHFRSRAFVPGTPSVVRSLKYLVNGTRGRRNLTDRQGGLLSVDGFAKASKYEAVRTLNFLET